MKKIKEAKSISFYIYKWGEEFTTFLIAESAQDALDIIAASREIACPPELQHEKLSKKNLKKAESNFILTINSPGITEDDNSDEVLQPLTLN